MSPRRFIKIAIAATIILFISVLFFHEISELSLLKNENRKIEKEIQELKRQNEAYRWEIDAVKNDREYLEKILRKDFGMIKDREKIFRFNEE